MNIIRPGMIQSFGALLAFAQAQPQRLIEPPAGKTCTLERRFTPDKPKPFPRA
jgi:hypothetical protein